MSYKSNHPFTEPRNKSSPTLEDAKCIPSVHSSRSINIDPKTSDTRVECALDPLNQETFILGPLRTLVASTGKELEFVDSSISIHDLIESYDVLSNRIESQASRLESLHGKQKFQASSFLALNVFKNLGSQRICAAIRRDISYALHPPEYDMNNFLCGEAVGNEGHICIKDRSDICHSALRLLASVFRFPSLYECFKAHELSWMFRLILNIGLSDNLMTLNVGKTYAFVIWIIRSQRLGTNIFRMFAKDIGKVLLKAIKGKMQSKTSHVEGLQAIRDYLILDGSLFLPEFREVFSATLQNLVSPFSEYRQLSAKALAAFSYSIVHFSPPLKTQLEYSKVVGAFIDKEEKSPLARIHKKKRSFESFVLHDYLNEEKYSDIVMLLNITASFILLSGPCAFSRPRSIKFLLKAIESAKQRSAFPELCTAREATWICLLRSYSLIPSWGVESNIDDEDRIRQLIGQEYSERIAGYILAALLASQDGTCYAIRYLHVLSEMRGTSDTIFTLLQRLVGGVRAKLDDVSHSEPDFGSIIPNWLLLGSSIGLKASEVKEILVTETSNDFTFIRCLDSEELLIAWDALLQIFKNFIIDFLSSNEDTDPLPDNISDMWMTLLSIQTTMMDGFSSEDVSKPVLSRLATLFLDLLKSPQVSEMLKPSQALLTSLQLWTHVKSELGETWASALAGASYRRLLLLWRNEIGHCMMSDAWAHLSREFVMAAPSRSMQILSELKDLQVQREVWLDMVFHLRSLKQPPPQVLIQALLFPLIVDDDVLKVEDMTLWRAILSLALVHGEPSHVLSKVSAELRSATISGSQLRLVKYFATVLEHVGFCGAPENIPLLEATGLFLETLYPPKNNKEFDFLDLIPSLHRLLSSGLSIDSLNAIQAGLVPWFGDVGCSIEDSVYSNDVLSLYNTIVSSLKQKRSLEDVFTSLETLLCSPFYRTRIPEPAVGPLAFKNLWDHALPTLNFTKETFPNGLTDCILGLIDAYGGVIPEWVEVKSGSRGSTSLPKIITDSIENHEIHSFSPISSHSSGIQESPEVVPDTSSVRTPKAKSRLLIEDHVNEDNVPTPLASPSLGASTLQFSKYLNRSPASEIVLSLDNIRSKKRRKVQSSPPFLSLDELAPSIDKNKQIPSPDDYDSWEVPVSSQDVRDLLEKHSSPLENTSRLKRASSSPHISNIEAVTPLEVSRNASQSNRSKTGTHSTRIPTSDDTFSGLCAPTPPKVTPSINVTEIPLDVLHHFKTAVRSDALLLQTQELADAQNVVHEIAEILNGEISKKLGIKGN